MKAGDTSFVLLSEDQDDRGYTFDTEIAACVTDDVLGRAGGQRFARDLRINLWHEHLGVPHSQLSDWDAAKRLWDKPPSSAMIVDSSDLEDSPLLGPKAVLRNFAQTDQLWREDTDLDADLLPWSS